MKLSEAYSILELPTTATPEEAKKKYRDLSKKYHPDINKEPGADDKFKKINIAYQCVSNGKGDEPEMPSSWGNPFSSVHFNRRPFQKQIRATHVEIHTTISFKDSVFGTKLDLKFTRQGKCQDCDGLGQKTLNNGCSKCNGIGQITLQRGNMIFTATCDKCQGQVKYEKCISCKGEATTSNDVSVNVSIPGGIENNSILKMGSMGNFAGSQFGMDLYTDALLFINVTPEEGLTLINKDVVSTISISLLEALQGCNKEVNTVIGKQEINIKPKSRNKEEIIISNLGVDRLGNQRVILDVQYPDNIDKLIMSLYNEEN